MDGNGSCYLGNVTRNVKYADRSQFWFQRANKASDLRAQVDLNAFLQDPSYRYVVVMSSEIRIKAP